MNGVMKAKRFKQWLFAIREDGIKPKSILKMIWYSFFLGCSKNLWKTRIRVCLKCPIYDLQNKICNGCVCLVSFNAMSRIRNCWGMRKYGIGWH